MAYDWLRFGSSLLKVVVGMREIQRSEHIRSPIWTGERSGKSDIGFLPIPPLPRLVTRPQIFRPSNMAAEYIRLAESRAYQVLPAAGVFHSDENEQTVLI